MCEERESPTAGDSIHWGVLKEPKGHDCSNSLRSQTSDVFSNKYNEESGITAIMLVRMLFAKSDC